MQSSTKGHKMSNQQQTSLFIVQKKMPEITRFKSRVQDRTVAFQIYKLTNSLLVWIALEDNPNFKELSMAMRTPYEAAPTAVRLLGDFMSQQSSAMAARLARKTGKQVYVSCNVGEEDSATLAGAEKRLVEEMLARPDCF